MYRCISLSRKYPEGKIGEKEPNRIIEAEQRPPKKLLLLLLLLLL